MNALKRVVRAGIKGMFHRGGIHAGIRRCSPSQLPVLLRYHSIGSGNTFVSKGIAVSLEAFEEQVAYFSRHFVSVTLDAVVDHIHQKVPCPPNAVVMTFDDGYADNYKAAQVLHRYGMTGVFYITAGCIESDEQFWVAEIRHLLENTTVLKIRLQEDNVELECTLEHRETAIRAVTKLIKSGSRRTRDSIREALWKQCSDVPPFPKDLMLTWSQLKEMANMGMEIGGHTVTHPNLPNATPEEAWIEISQCKTMLEEQTGCKVHHFAYPNGGAVDHYNEKVKGLVRQAGFWSASTSKPDLIRTHADVFELRRMRATENLSEMLWEIEELRLQKSRK